MTKKRKVAVYFKLSVPIIVEKDTEINEYIATCPVLDIWSQGSAKKDAEKNIREAVSLFLLSCYERGTLNEVLIQSGFKPVINKPLSAPKRRKSLSQKFIQVQIPLEVAC